MALNALFVTSSVIGIGNFIASLFADQDMAHTTIRVCAGINDTPDPNDSSSTLDGADGKIASIHTYNANDDLMGTSDSGSITSGSYTDFTADQIDSEQAQYVRLVADSDAVCIAYVSTTWVDGTKWMWVGDWGNPCGLTWFYSGITAGTESDGSGHTTQCTWMDSDGSPDTDTSQSADSLKIGVSTFGDNGKVGDDASSMCGLPYQSAYSDTDGTAPIFKRGFSNKKRNNSKRKDNRAVISNHEAHNATYLCEHENSRGPSFVSLFEGKYCDMETREVLDVCTDDITTDCYNTKTDKVVGGQKRSAKEFSSIIRW